MAEPHIVSTTDAANSPVGSLLQESGTTATTSTSWPGAKVVVYLPIVIRTQFTVRTIGWQNGTTPSGNIEVGVYDESGTRKGTSGSTAAGTTAAIQLTTPSAFTLAPGRYYLAMTCDATTYTVNAQAPAAGSSGSIGVMTETTGSFGLPNPWGSVAVLTASETLARCFIADSTVV